jgi:hypothetical protein
MTNNSCVVAYTNQKLEWPVCASPSSIIVTDISKIPKASDLKSVIRTFSSAVWSDFMLTNRHIVGMSLKSAAGVMTAAKTAQVLGDKDAGKLGLEQIWSTTLYEFVEPTMDATLGGCPPCRVAMSAGAVTSFLSRWPMRGGCTCWGSDKPVSSRIDEKKRSAARSMKSLMKKVISSLGKGLLALSLK